MQTVAGYCIEFEKEPIQANIPNEIKFSKEQNKCVDFEIQELLKKCAIVHSEWEQNQFISNIFIVPKPNGRFRPIIYLKYLNYFVSYEHFKQETFKTVLELVQENDYFTNSNQPPSVAPRRGATRELVALQLERFCSVLFTPIHLPIRIDNIFGIAEFRYLYGVDTGNQSRSN